MATDATITVDSSSTDILKSLTPAQTKTWRTTGELPEVKETPKEKPKAEAPKEKTEAASSTAAKSEVTEAPAKATETPAESVPAKTESRPKHEGAEARIKDLLAENKRLATELEAARKVPTVAPAKIEEVAKPHRNDVDPKTGQAKYATDDAFEEAHEKYLTAKVTKDVEARHAKAQSDARLAEQNRIIAEKWQNSLKIATEQHPDFAEVLQFDDKGGSKNEAVKSIKANGVLDAWILDSEIGASLLYHLAKNPAEIARIQSLNPFAAARELTRLEQKLGSAAPAKTTPIKEEKAADSTIKKVSSAPAPATSVGGKNAPPVDEEDAALSSEDFARYQKAANAAEFRQKKAS
jgi:hypothetical protein